VGLDVAVADGQAVDVAEALEHLVGEQLGVQWGEGVAGLGDRLEQGLGVEVHYDVQVLRVVLRGGVHSVDFHYVLVVQLFNNLKLSTLVFLVN